MNMNFLGASAITAVLATAAPALAITVVLDDFDGSQLAIDDPFTGTSNSDTVAFGAGTRTVEAENITNGGNAQGATRLEVAGGLLQFSNNANATGTGTLTYTNVGDIELGENAFFDFNFLPFDGVARFMVTVMDTMMNTSTYEEILLPGFDSRLFFSQFTGDADFNSVATLSFMIDSENVPAIPGSSPFVDGSLDSIEIGAVPLPATGLLLMGALGGAAALRRRKQKAA